MASLPRSRARPPPRTHARIKAERRGRLAESLCVVYLRMTGWRILERRLKARPGYGLGEIDIVAKRGAVVAFIEVKSRSSSAAAHDAVTLVQRARIARAADAFAARDPACANCALRFDLMIVGPRLIPARISDAWRPGF